MKFMKNIMHHLVFAIGYKNNDSIQILGTAFHLKDNIICTTFHNIKNKQDLVLIINNMNGINDYQDYSDKKCTYLNLKTHRVNPHRDIALLKIEDNKYINNNFNFSDLDILSECIVVGFPHSTEDSKGRKILTFQKTNIGAKILLENSITKIKNKHYVLNIQTRPGQSGSPVFDKNYNLSAMIIGSHNLGDFISIAGLNPSSLNQTTYALSAEYIKEML